MNDFSGVLLVLCMSLLLCKAKKVVIFGGTGRTGRTVIQKLMAEPSVSLFTLTFVPQDPS